MQCEFPRAVVLSLPGKTRGARTAQVALLDNAFLLIEGHSPAPSLNMNYCSTRCPCLTQERRLGAATLRLEVVRCHDGFISEMGQVQQPAFGAHLLLWGRRKGPAMRSSPPMVMARPRLVFVSARRTKKAALPSRPQPDSSPPSTPAGISSWGQHRPAMPVSYGAGVR